MVCIMNVNFFVCTPEFVFLYKSVVSYILRTVLQNFEDIPRFRLHDVLIIAEPQNCLQL
jgi:hypothetical protein